MYSNFKPKDIPDELLTYGVYFKSKSDISTQYLIEILKGEFDGNALVKIYTTCVLENYFETDFLINGAEIAIPEYEAEWVVDIDLYGKYFFTKFNNNIQFSYDSNKYYNDSDSTDSITSLSEAINFAIEYGLTKSNIRPY